jgi:hypothetical protein
MLKCNMVLQFLHSTTRNLSKRSLPSSDLWYFVATQQQSCRPVHLPLVDKITQHIVICFTVCS